MACASSIAWSGVDFNVFASRPTLGPADVPSLLWRALSVEPRMSGRATSFYYSFLALPADKRTRSWRSGISAGRSMMPSMSRARRSPRRALQRWRGELARVYEGGRPATVQGRQLLPFVSQFALPRSAFEDLIDGVAMDLERRRYDTFEALRQYCLRVASAVGLICVEIFGYRDVQTRDYAIDLGIALQLTNIIRDVATDLRARARVHPDRGSASGSGAPRTICARAW